MTRIKRYLPFKSSLILTCTTLTFKKLIPKLSSTMLHIVIDILN
ncbi:hypothetical protein LDVICp219 [lymphocystis disease virus-China]|uniref:Uncharacterized protein n=1 Tax=lymphocystis disease virus-China TaxID=256729 RepID=Q677P5_9VIRU|nr:hypothetical protein LDVICp219 [lymphocystis disease virus-China]AAU11062.1 hypothetical protein [lymphocystis disease virus-China]